MKDRVIVLNTATRGPASVEWEGSKAVIVSWADTTKGTDSKQTQLPFSPVSCDKLGRRNGRNVGYLVIC